MHSAVREARAAHRCGRRARCEVVVLVRLRLFNLVPSHEGRGPHTRWQSLTPRVKLSCQHWRERCFWRRGVTNGAHNKLGTPTRSATATTRQYRTASGAAGRTEQPASVEHQ